MNTKELVEKCFKGRAVPRPPFIPLIGNYFTKVDQVTVEQMYNDSSSLSSAIENTRELIGYDALITPVDLTLEAEAIGAGIEWKEQEMPIVRNPLSIDVPIEAESALANGRIPLLIETLERLVAIRGKEYPIIGVINGPMTVLKETYGESIFQSDREILSRKVEKVSRFLSMICKSMGDAKIDGVIINEEVKIDSEYQYATVRGYTPILNVIKFYNLFAATRIVIDDHTEISNFPDTLIAPSSFLTTNKVKTKGIALETDFWDSELDHASLSTLWKENKKRRMFLSTNQTLHIDIDLSIVQEKASKLCDAGAWA